MTQTCISPREKEVLNLIADENSTKMIAKELFISEHTVISHRKNLMTKLNASNTAGLVRRAFETGVLHLSRQVAMFFALCVTVVSMSAQSTELTNFQLRYFDSSEDRIGVMSHNGSTLILSNEMDNGVLSMSADAQVQILNEHPQGRWLMYPNGRIGVGLTTSDFSGRFAKFSIRNNSTVDTAQLILVETEDADDFTRLRFMNDSNLVPVNGGVPNWTLAASVGDPDDYRFIVALNSQARLRYREDNGEWEFFSDPALNSRIVVDEIELNGSDFAEKFEISPSENTEIQAGYVVSIDPDNAGQLKIADESYDKRVVGIISGAKGINPGMIMGQEGTIADGDYPVALSGRVYVSTTDVNGTIEPGDMLTTSEMPGHAMKAKTKKNSYGSIIGKALTAPDQNGYVLVLVNLQ